MKNTVLKTTSLILALLTVFMILPSLLTEKVFAASNLPLDGIDYKRLTQKASSAMSTFDVRMKIGEVELKGLMMGSEGLTMGEMNEIILSELKKLNLSLEEAEVLSALGENLERSQWKEFGKRLAVAVSEYIPSAGPAGVVNPTDIVKFALYGDNPLTAAPQSVIIGKEKQALEKEITDALQKEAKLMGKTIKKKGGGLWLVGFALNSISAGEDLADEKEYEKFCKKLEKEYAKIAEFYAKCSQRLNDEAELKNFGRGIITFDERSVNTTECTFLGVSGVKMRYRLSGTLRKQIADGETVVAGDNSGTYEGDLKLEIEGANLANDFDAVFADQTTIWKGTGHLNDWCQILYRFSGQPVDFRENFLNKFIFTVNRPTYLKRTLVGHFKVKIPIPEINGTVTPVLNGSFNNVSDGIDFIFRMTFGQEFKFHEKDPQTMKDLGLPVQQWHLETLLQQAPAISSLHCTWVGNQAAKVMLEGSVGNIVYGGDGQDVLITASDLGTVWKPLEEAPVLTISSF